MRKYFVTGFYLLILGAILCVGGYIAGGAQMVAWDHGFKISQRVNETKNLKSFSKVKVNGKNVSVRVEKGNKYSINISGDKLQLPTYKIKDDTLIITGHKSKPSVDFKGRGEHVVVTVPKTESLKKMHVNLSEGNVRLRNLTIKKLSKSNRYWNSDSAIYLDNVKITEQSGSKFFFDEGYIRINNSTINNLNFEADDDSTVDIRNSKLNNYKFKMSESNLRITNSTMNGGSIDMDDGHVHFNRVTINGTNDYILTDESDFRSESSKMDGVDFSGNDINYFGEKKSGNYQSSPDSENLLKVNATDGSIRVQ